MTLYLIGLGLQDEKDISVRGLEIVQSCERIYVENYTSVLSCTIPALEKFYGQKVIPATRELAEQGGEKIVEEARNKKVAFLIIGDPFSATTHLELLRMAHEKKVPVQVIHNASVLTAVGSTGLQLYKFGRVASIPFAEDVPELDAPYDVLQQNLKSGLHTLFLLDLKPGHKFMTIADAMSRLEEMENTKKKMLITPNLLTVGCARLGSKEEVINAGEWDKIKKFNFGKPPYCLILPSRNLHFMEKEVLEFYK